MENCEIKNQNTSNKEIVTCTNEDNGGTTLHKQKRRPKKNSTGIVCVLGDSPYKEQIAPEAVEYVREKNISPQLNMNGKKVKTIIRIEFDNSPTTLQSNLDIFRRGVGKENKKAFKQIRKEIYEMLNSPTVKIYVDTKQTDTTDENMNFALANTCPKDVPHKEKISQEQNPFSLAKTLKVNKNGGISKKKVLGLKGGKKWPLLPLKKQFEDLLRSAKKLKYGKYIAIIEKDLETIMKKVFPDISIDIYCYGPRLYGLGNSSSNLNVYIDIGKTLDRFEDFPSAMTLDTVQKVRRALSKNCEEKLDHGNKTPELIVQHRSGICCKLSFSNILGKTTSILIEYLFKLQPIARYMSLYLILWKEHFSPDCNIDIYHMVWMVVFYLQTINILPSIKKIQQHVNENEAIYVGPWICSYVSHELDELDLRKINSSYECCLDLMEGFFYFYAHYENENNVICPYWGRSLSKSEFKSFMPHRYHVHVENTSCNLELNVPVVLQDPIQLNKNVMDDISPEDFDTFKNLYVDTKQTDTTDENMNFALANTCPKDVPHKEKISQEQNPFSLAMTLKVNKNGGISKKKVLGLKGGKKWPLLPHKKQFEDLLRSAEKLKYGKYIAIIEKDLETIMKKVFPDISIDIYCYGPRLYGLGNSSSNLNVYIDIGKTLDRFEDFPSAMTLDTVQKVRRALSKNCEEKLDHGNKTPELIVQHRSGICCKLSFSNILGKTTSILIEYLFKLQPIARYMSLYLILWKEHFSPDCNIGIYHMVWMVVFYLQTINILPSIKKIQQHVNENEAIYVGPWICSYVSHELDELDLRKINSSYECCLDLMDGFFYFYAHYEYENNVICPYWGRSLSKSEFKSFMPHRYHVHVENTSCNLELNVPVVLQDPIQLNKNVMDDISPEDFDTFKNSINGAFQWSLTLEFN